MCTAATSLPTILSRSLRPRSSSLRKASKRLVGGPLSRATLIVSLLSGAKPVWKERGILVSEMVARNGLIVLNRGRDFTFRRGVGGSIIDLTIAEPRLGSRIGDWCVLEGITLSDHQCIEFSIQDAGHLHRGDGAEKGSRLSVASDR